MKCKKDLMDVGLRKALLEQDDYSLLCLSELESMVDRSHTKNACSEVKSTRLSKLESLREKCRKQDISVDNERQVGR